MSDRLLRDVVRSLFPKGFSHTVLKWPPDAFALTSSILAESGAYRRVVDPPQGQKWPPGKDVKQWTESLQSAATQWRRWWELRGARIPAKVAQIAAVVRANLNVPIRKLGDPPHWTLCSAILELHAIADMACEGLGIPGYFSKDSVWFHSVGAITIQTTGSLSSLPTDQIKVLPKLRTPQVGMSLRSLSHYVAADRTEVGVDWQWHPSLCDATDMKLNLLLLPWPLQIEAHDFVETNGPLENMDKSSFGFFEFRPKRAFDVAYAERTIKRARQKVGHIHGVVLPEGALTSAEVKKLENVLKPAGIRFFVAGVRGSSKNYAHLGLLVGRRWQPYRQDKHHRWLLDGAQIHTYHLGSSLHPGKKYWESIELPPRRVGFVSANWWLTLCHLICEDLARQDPVTQLVRAVGPNLVLALLLDGPQLGQRWPGRYASVLADDPGSSVLSVTSLGMATRSRPDGKPASRVVALWKDARTGLREIELPKEADAAILTICAHRKVEWAADGRTDEGAASELVLSGIEFLDGRRRRT